MAANRQNVPIRQGPEILKVDDGTMCRMPSPRPGPLRGDGEADLSSFRSGSAANPLSSRSSGSEVENTPVPFAAGNAA